MKQGKWAAALVAGVACVSITGMALANKAKVGDPAPQYSVATFEHQRITSDQLKGQVVILNFWATWCGPCKRELPVLDAYSKAHAKDGLRIFAVATEDSVPDTYLRPLERVLSFPLVHYISNRAYGPLEGVPTSYVIDRGGVIRYAKADAFDEATLDEVVGPLLAEPVPAATAAPAAKAAP